MSPLPSHTHFFFFLLYALSIKDIGQDLETMLQHSDRCGLAYDNSAFHLVFSLPLTSCTSSLLITSIHRSGVLPGLLFFPCGLHLRSCFWRGWSGIHCMWPSHCSRLCLNCSSTGNSPVSFRRSTFWCRVSPRMSRRHLILKVFSLLMSCSITGQVSVYTTQKDRLTLTLSRKLNFGGLAKVTAPEDFLPPHLIHFASLLKPHCNSFLFLGTLTNLTAQVRE